MIDGEFYDWVDQIATAESIAVGHIPPITTPVEFTLGVVLDDGDPDDPQRPSRPPMASTSRAC
ncbi:hypothetical protein [Nocardia sp. NPDC051981]|uniref:hypothetical protein n=1 Tax=Nocardia sp. NPDC051981 TaxID=3155417 RepID=UPI0034327B03